MPPFNQIIHGNENISFLGHEEIAKLLIQNGANVKIVGCSGTALTLAAAEGKNQ